MDNYSDVTQQTFIDPLMNRVPCLNSLIVFGMVSNVTVCNIDLWASLTFYHFLTYDSKFVLCVQYDQRGLAVNGLAVCVRILLIILNGVDLVAEINLFVHGVDGGAFCNHVHVQRYVRECMYITCRLLA